MVSTVQLDSLEFYSRRLKHVVKLAALSKAELRTELLFHLEENNQIRRRNNKIQLLHANFLVGDAPENNQVLIMDEAIGNNNPYIKMHSDKLICELDNAMQEATHFFEKGRLIIQTLYDRGMDSPTVNPL